MMFKKSSQGLTLVELMVSVVLGLLITAATIQLFITNRQMFNLQQGTASVLEQGQFAADFLTKEMMTAGYGTVSQAFERSQSADGDRYDSVRIVLAEGSDCSGGELNEDDSTPEPWKEYSVVVDGNGNGVLTCEDSDGTTNQLVDNVEAFQILYGVSPSADETIARGYFNRASLLPEHNIVSIRYAILIASDQFTNYESESVGQDALNLNPQMFVLDQAYDTQGGLISFDDGRLRRLFVSTVALRNVAGG